MHGAAELSPNMLVSMLVDTSVNTSRVCVCVKTTRAVYVSTLHVNIHLSTLHLT